MTCSFPRVARFAGNPGLRDLTPFGVNTSHLYCDVVLICDGHGFLIGWTRAAGIFGMKAFRSSAVDKDVPSTKVQGLLPSEEITSANDSPMKRSLGSRSQVRVGIAANVFEPSVIMFFGSPASNASNLIPFPFPC